MSEWSDKKLGIRSANEPESFQLFEGYEVRRIFAVDCVYGEAAIIGRIGECGSIFDDLQNDIGYEFDDVIRWCYFELPKPLKKENNEQ